jgi:hypothetical protein
MEVAKYQDISFGMKSRLQRAYKTPILTVSWATARYRERLPRIRLPLAAPDLDIVLDIQDVLT